MSHGNWNRTNRDSLLPCGGQHLITSLLSLRENNFLHFDAALRRKVGKELSESIQRTHWPCLPPMRLDVSTQQPKYKQNPNTTLTLPRCTPYVYSEATVEGFYLTVTGWPELFCFHSCPDLFSQAIYWQWLKANCLAVRCFKAIVGCLWLGAMMCCLVGRWAIVAYMSDSGMAMGERCLNWLLWGDWAGDGGCFAVGRGCERKRFIWKHN